jgi:hypothetical protein
MLTQQLNCKAIVFATLLGILLLAAGANADLAALGPIHPSNGYPVYYQDFTGLSLEQCLDTLDPLCGVLPVPDPLSPVSFPDNFPDEFFYWLGTSTMPTNGGGQALLVMALEGAFGGATGGVVPGEQIVFGRIRFRVDNLIQGATYTITHPYGVDTFVAEGSAANSINFTEDIGGFTVPNSDFSVALNSRIGPFLAWDPAESAPPVGYVGDPAIDHTVTGSPFGTNFFRIEGPSVGGPGVDVIQTDLFSVQGKIFTGVVPSPLTVDRSSYSRQSNAPNPDSGQIAVFATSVGTSTLEVSGAGLVTTPMLQDPFTPGKFFALLTSSTPGSFPTSITVTNTADSPPTDVNSSLVDEVTIDVASFDEATGELTIHASSSDLLSPPTLTAEGLGLLDAAGDLVVPGLLVPPPTLTVTSSAGGSDTELVTVIAAPAAPGNIPPTALDDTAVTTQDMSVTFSVVVNDFDPDGTLDLATVTIVTQATNGTAMVFDVDPDGTVTYTPNAGFTGTDSFTYTVDDDQGATSNVATVQITVNAPDTLTVTRAEFRTGKSEWRVDGTATVITANVVTVYAGPTVGGPVIGTAIVDTLGVWSFRERNSPIPASTTISVESSAGGILEGVPVTIRN